MLTSRAILTTLLLSSIHLAGGCATQEDDAADLEISLGGGKADEFGAKTLALTIGNALESSVGDTSTAEVTVRFRSEDKLSVRADLVAFATLLAWDEAAEKSISDHILTFEAQAKNEAVTMGFALFPFDPEEGGLHDPIEVDGSTLFEHIAVDFGTKEITKNGEKTLSFEAAGIETFFAYGSVAVVAVPLETSDDTDFDGTYKYDLVTSVR